MRKLSETVVEEHWADLWDLQLRTNTGGGESLGEVGNGLFSNN